MKRLTELLAFLVLLGTACAPSELSANTPTPKAQIQAEIPSPTPAALTNAQVLDGPNINYNGIRFTLNPDFGSHLYTFDDITTVEGLTAHSTRFALSPEEYCQTWCLMVYPIADFTQAFGTFIFPPAGYKGGAATIFKAKEISLSFQNGIGDRGLESFGQNHYKVSNESLKYVFRGYSTDKQYAIFVQVPVHASNLPNTTPTITTNDNPVQEILEYNQQASQSMNALTPADFTPNLDLLDTLVASIYVGIPQ